MRNKKKEAELWLRIGCKYIQDATKRLSGAAALRLECAVQGRTPSGIANLLDRTGSEATDLLTATANCMSNAITLINDQAQQE